MFLNSNTCDVIFNFSGTCDNDQKNDCRIPNGQIASSCPDMAYEWRVDNSLCKPPPPSPPPPPPPPNCKPDICEILISK